MHLPQITFAFLWKIKRRKVIKNNSTPTYNLLDILYVDFVRIVKNCKRYLKGNNSCLERNITIFHTKDLLFNSNQLTVKERH